MSEFDESAIAPIVTGGVFLRYKDLNVGISADNLLESTFEFDADRSDIAFNQIRHYFGYISYDVGISNDILLKPSVFLEAEVSELQINFNIAAEFKERFILGAGYRGYSEFSSDSVVLQGGIKMNNNLQFYYAYDLGLSDLSTTNSGSHEILIKYEIDSKIGKGVPPPIIFNPRFL